jgi:protease-4
VTTESGIEHTYITGGQYKDTGSPYRRMTPEERDHWQQSIDNEYRVFVDHVSRHRPISSASIVNEIKALPYDSLQARSLKLVDEIASEDVAVEELADRAGLGNSYQLIAEKSKTDFLSALFSVYTQVKQPTAQSVSLLCNTPLYLYDRTYSLLGK